MNMSELIMKCRCWSWTSTTISKDNGNGKVTNSIVKEAILYKKKNYWFFF